MLLRCLLLLIPGLLIGCMSQRDSADTPGDDPAATDTTRGGGMPNIAAYPYGAWGFTATEIGGDDTMTGTLLLAEAEGASRLTTSDGLDAPLLIDEFDVTNNAFVLSGVVQDDDGPMPVSIAGLLAGDEMSAEAELEGRGTYALTAVRQ
jgi:hypothetical protein